ncbi:DNA primase [Patescibacteria group bacterium]|nr:DNA primase [Patescibacteria group bacterium]MCL5410165.1 DNA primase [Patescibacteria group bacterium]
MDDLELIKERINVVDLIAEYLPLKKTGVNFKANCPFHQEKTPSFVVSPERGIWHCFGCQKGGDIFRFLMEKEGVDFSEALETLAKKAGVTLKRQAHAQTDQKERLIAANQKAAQFYHYILTEHKLGQKALSYLHQRGVTDETIKKFKLGYAPNSWDSLTNFLKKRGFKNAEMVEAGLVVPSRNSVYDRFRGRVIFPLINLKDEVVGFSGRILAQGEPKYLNTPVTPIFDKSHFLFGLNFAKATIRSKKQVILVEGLLDMIMPYQAGVENTVAVQGTALTDEQIKLIAKYAEDVCLSFDKDVAGDSAARRSIELLDGAGLNTKVIEIKGGKDPADMVVGNPQDFIQAVAKAEPVYDYYLNSISLRFNPSNAEGKKKIAAELLPIWGKINETMTREYYTQKLAALLNMPEDLLRREIRKSSLKVASPSFDSSLLKTTAEQTLGLPNRRDLLEEYLLALLLKIPSNLTYVPQFPETLFLSEVNRSIYVLLVLYLDAISFKAKAFNISEFVKGLPKELVPVADRLYLVEIDEKLESADNWKKEIEIVVAALKKALVKASLEKLSREIKNAQLFGRIEQLETLNRRFRDLSVKLKNL